MTDLQAIASEVRTFVLENLRTYLTRGEGAIEALRADFDPAISFIPAADVPEVQGIEEMVAIISEDIARHPDAIPYEVRWAKERVLHEALAVVDLAAALAFSESETMTLRGTFVCEKREGRWWIVNLYGSMPSRIGPEELWPLDELRARNAELEREVARQTDALQAALREAQVEASLERIRSRTMAMQQSSELGAVIQVVFRQALALGFGARACDLVILDEETGASLWYIAGELDAEDGEPLSFQVPYFDHPHYVAGLEAWKNKEAIRHAVLEGDVCADYMQRLTGLATEGNVPEEVKAFVLGLRYIVHTEAYMRHGYFRVASLEPLREEEKKILQRFARVFEQTYTRFLDLQKAEAQAREATRQASLDRVRGEIASMRTTDDLNRITPLIWRELTTLSVPFFRCGVLIFDEETETVQAFISNPQGESVGALTLPFDADTTTKDALNCWRKHEVFRDQWDREQFVRWTKTVLEQGLMKATDHFTELEDPPEHLALHFVPFTQGMLYVGSESPLSEDQVDLVQDLADAFAAAYARYEDFNQLEMALSDLKATQNQLIHAEKMASLGQMTAGIAHEIKNPLNFVNNFAELNAELADELAEALEEGEDVSEILSDLKENAGHIARHGKRADSIVRSMMQHARGGSGEKEPVAINTMIEEYVNLAYHGMRASRPDFNCDIQRDYDEDVGEVRMQGQDIGRVLLNLLGNAFDAVRERGEKSEERGGMAYVPVVQVSTQRVGDAVEIRVKDNGPGISEEVKARIFEPFFTTKPTGAGTGLGLSLSYDIVTQGHGGMLAVESVAGEGATFTIRLPVKSDGTVLEV